jgi:hypothetical protein
MGTEHHDNQCLRGADAHTERDNDTRRHAHYSATVADANSNRLPRAQPNPHHYTDGHSHSHSCSHADTFINADGNAQCNSNAKRNSGTSSSGC